MSSTIENNKRILKNTLFLYIRMLLLMVTNLYTSRVILNALGVDDFGIYNVVGGIIVILSFLNSAMAGGTQRFLNVEMGKNNFEGLKQVFSTSIHIHLIVSICVLFIAETIGLWFLNTQMNIPNIRIEAANWVYQFSIATCIIGIMSVPYNATIIAHEKMSAFAYISIVEALLKLIVAFITSIYSADKLIFYAFLMLIVSIINRIIYKVYANNHFKECSPITWKKDKQMMRQMLSFSGWSIVGNLSFILHTHGIGILINMFFSVAVNAAQGIANQVNSIVNQFVSNFLTALNPQVVKTYAAKELEIMHSLICRGCKMAFFLVSFFVIPIALEAPTILQLWLGIVPNYTVTFIRLILLITLINSFSYLLATAKGATGKIKIYQITLTLIGTLHLPFTWLAFKLGFGPEYSMYIYIIIVIILQIIRIWFVCISVRLSIKRFIYEVITKCTLVLLISSLIPIILHLLLEPSLYATFIIIFTSIITVTLTIFYIGFTSKERNIILTPIIKKFKRNN